MIAVSIDVVVAIVAYNSAHVIGDLLDSIPAAAGSTHVQVVVVDNGSTDGTIELVRARTDCQLIESTNVGYAGGINRAVAAGDPSAPILILNPDITLRAMSIVRLLDALTAPGVGIIAPRVESPDGSLYRSLRREPTLARAIGLNRTRLSVFSEYVDDPAAYDTAHVADWALGAALLVSRSCWNSVGEWDESYFLYSEETDFCLKARDLGFVTRYEPSAVVMHVGAQSGQSPQTHAMQIINRVRLYRRRHTLARSWLYLMLTIVSEISWGVRGHRQSWFAIRALVQPSARPAVLQCSDTIMPR
jgi:N-acetylglucosaminyl-diphospho-decaprenol L-rhamnosyltransferase